MPSSRPCGYSQIIKCLFKMNIDSWTLFPGIIIQLLSKGPNNRIFKVPPMIRVWKPPVFRIQTPVSCRWTPSYDIALCTGFHISPFTLLGTWRSLPEKHELSGRWKTLPWQTPNLLSRSSLCCGSFVHAPMAIKKNELLLWLRCENWAFLILRPNKARWTLSAQPANE